MRASVRLLSLVLASLVVLVARSASAHQSSFSYATVELVDGGRRANYEIRLSSNDLYEALELDEERDATDAEIEAGARRLQNYVFAQVELDVADQLCVFTPGAVRALRDGGRFAQLEASLTCPKAIAAIDFHYTLFFDLDERHEGLMTAEHELVQFAYPDHTRFHFEPHHSHGASMLGFLRSGVHHVLSGADHILFLISLLLVMAWRARAGELELRAPGATMRRTAAIVSAFTVGHSITLILAALGWVELPSRFVESMIAASIVYVAIENLFRPDPAHRALVGFSFGLMHGLGFAAMLRPLLPPSATVMPLLAFNIGVELGQLAVVLATLPLLYLLMRTLGVDWYRRRFLPIACVAVSLMGLVWLVERAFEIRLLGL